MELTRFRRRCWGERKKEARNAKNPSTIRAGVLSQNLNPDVLMMEPAEDWYCCDGAELRQHF